MPRSFILPFLPFSSPQCSWPHSQDLELRVCGLPEIDLAFLREHTHYQVGLADTDQHIQFFWRVLESLQPDELRMFIKFACNLERIPTTCSCKKAGVTAHVPPYPMKLAPPDGSGMSVFLPSRYNLIFLFVNVLSTSSLPYYQGRRTSDSFALRRACL